MVPSVEASGMDEDHWNKRWEKNWQILLTVLHSEDFPLLRNSQHGMGSADAGDMLLGRNEVANQVYHAGDQEAARRRARHRIAMNR